MPRGSLWGPRSPRALRRELAGFAEDFGSSGLDMSERVNESGVIGHFETCVTGV